MPYKDPAKEREKKRRWAEKHKNDPEQIKRDREKCQRWRARNKDKVKALNEQFKAKNPDYWRNHSLNYLDASFRWDEVEGFDGWTVNTEVHHRLEMFGYSADELKAKGWYYNCTPDELLCLSNSEHRRLHHYLTRISL